MKKTMSEIDSIEAKNLLESANEIMSECINCGLCKQASALTRALKEEHYSARGQAQLLNNNILDNLVFAHTLCKAEQFVCPRKIDIDEAIRKARQALVLKGKGHKHNETMITNIKKHRNAYGKPETKSE